MGVAMRIVCGAIGAAFGFASMLALSPGLAAFDNATGAAYAVIVVGALLGYFAPTIRRSLGRGFLLLGASIFVLPISAMLLTGRVAHETVSADPTSVIGAGLAGAAFTGLATVVGFFLGAVFLLAGLVLVLGGRREVSIVSPPPGKPSAGRREPTF